MDLSAILQKTKEKSKKITTKRKPPSIAIEERPYSFEEETRPAVNIAPEIEEPTNKRQTEDKLETNTDSMGDNPETNQGQTEDISKTSNTEEFKTEDETRDTIEDKLETVPVQKIALVKENFNDDQYSLTPFSSLVGIQRKIVLFIHEECKLNRSKITPPLTMEYILASCGSNFATVKKSIQRLEKKRILLRAGFKNGRGGWTRYELADQVYNEILYTENYRTASSIQNELKDKLETKLRTNVETSSPSSSSYNIKTTTTDLPHDWKIINTDPLRNIGFGYTEIRNIFNKGSQLITPDVVQDSINQFAFGLINNPERYKSMKSPAAILVSNLSQGTPWIETNYISPEEKLKVEKEAQMKSILEKQFKEPKFLEWFNQLQDSDKENFVPDALKSSTSYMISKVIMQKEHAIKFFENTVWPNLLAELTLAMKS